MVKRSVLTKVTYIYCSLTTISRRSQGLWCLVPPLVVIAVTPVPSGTGPAAVAAYSCSALKHVAVDVAWLEYLSSTPWIKKVLEVKRECKMESSRIGIWPTRELLSCLCRHWPGTRRVLTGTHRVLTSGSRHVPQILGGNLLFTCTSWVGSYLGEAFATSLFSWLYYFGARLSTEYADVVPLVLRSVNITQSEGRARAFGKQVRGSPLQWLYVWMYT